jgi:hypothetical protein
MMMHQQGRVPGIFGLESLRLKLLTKEPRVPLSPFPVFFFFFRRGAFDRIDVGSGAGTLDSTAAVFGFIFVVVFGLLSLLLFFDPAAFCLAIALRFLCSFDLPSALVFF